MRRILEDVLFDLSPFGDQEERRRWLRTHFDYLPGRMADDAFFEEVLALRDTYLKRADVLVHGDLHTSNMMMDPAADRLVVFDHEYTHMGAYSTDLGYLLGNFLFPCIAFRYRHDLSPAERDRGGRVPLHQAVEVMDAFFRHFRACWAADAKPMYRDHPGYMDKLFAGLIPEVAGLMGLQAMDRIFGPGAMQDYELVADGPDLEEARLLTVVVTQTLIMCRNELRSMADVVALVEDTLARFDKAGPVGGGV
jgi:5-methylthioribose kinase